MGAVRQFLGLLSKHCLCPLVFELLLDLGLNLIESRRLRRLDLGYLVNSIARWRHRDGGRIVLLRSEQRVHKVGSAAQLRQLVGLSNQSSRSDGQVSVFTRLVYALCAS